MRVANSRNVFALTRSFIASGARSKIAEIAGSSDSNENNVGVFDSRLFSRSMYARRTSAAYASVLPIS